MKILMFCNTLWQNNLVRTFPFYRVLSREHDVTVVGPLKRGASIFEPYRDSMNYHPWRLPPGPRLPADLAGLARDCDLVHCFKPLPWSYFPSLVLKVLGRRPLVLDIEDLDYYPLTPRDHFRLRRFSTALSPVADAVVVNSVALQQRFGGEIIYTGADTERFHPGISGDAVRERLGLGDDFTVVHAGTLKRYKGVDTLVDAVSCSRVRARVVLVGADPAVMDPFSMRMLEEYRKRLGDRLVVLPPQPIGAMPGFLAAADAVFLPHKFDGPHRGFETPARLFEAMAMGKPVVASSFGDVPAILEGAGLRVAPGDAEACRDALERLAGDPGLRAELGRKARRRCVEFYSWKVLQSRILEVYRRVLPA